MPQLVGAKSGFNVRLTHVSMHDDPTTPIFYRAVKVKVKVKVKAVNLYSASS